MTDRRRTALLALGLYALAAFALQLRLPGATLYGDEHEYVYLGGRLAAGRGYTFGPSAAGLVPGGSFDTPGRGSWFTPPDPAEPGPSVPTAWRQPGVPAVLAAIDAFVPGTLQAHVPATRRVYALLLALHAPLLVALGTLLGQRRAGAVAAVVWTVDPVSRYLAQHLLAEGLASLLVCAGLAAVLHARRPRSTPRAPVAWALAGGLALGAAVLTRGYLLVLLVLVAGWALVRRPAQSRAALVALLASAALLPAAWVARNAVRMHSATLSTQTWEQVYVGNDALARGSWAGSRSDRATRTRTVLAEDPAFFSRSEAGREAVLRRLAFDELTDHPVRTLTRLPKKAAITLASPQELSGRDPVWLLALLAVAALLLAPAVRLGVPTGDVALLLAPLVAVVAASIVTFGETRFRVPATGPVLLLAAIAVTGLVGRRAPMRRMHR